MKKKILLSFLTLSCLAAGTTLFINGNQKEELNELVSLEELENTSVSNNQNLQSYDVVEAKSTYSIDVNDLTEVVKDADVVFVASVDSINGTDYRHPVEFLDENGEVEEIIYSPYTNYTVTVLNSISGEFDPLQKLSIYKTGGIEQNQQFVEVLEGDELPIVGNSYIFTAYIQDDGSLLVSGVNSTTKVDPTVVESIDFKNISKDSDKEIQEELSEDVGFSDYVEAYSEFPSNSEEVNENIDNIDEGVFVDNN